MEVSLDVEDIRMDIALRAEGSAYRLVVEDNGVGLHPGYDWRRATTLGFGIVRILAVDQLGGSVVADGGPGARFEISFARREENSCKG
jgi:two-component sensor histidine kinase